MLQTPLSYLGSNIQHMFRKNTTTIEYISATKKTHQNLTSLQKASLVT